MTKLKLCLAILSLPFSFGWAQIKLPKLISDGVVLQRDTNLNIWGWSAPNEIIEIRFKDKSCVTTADDKGQWRFQLPPQKAGGPYSMTFAASNTIEVKNILFGDVWICSGQSNMELPMKRLKDQYPEEIKQANNPQIRQFTIPDEFDFNTEHNDVSSGNWIDVNSKDIYEFSGVAYFFAKELHQKYHVPIGLINSALGGSPIEAWMSEDALKQFPSSYDELQKFKDVNFVEQLKKDDNDRQNNWYKDVNTNDLGNQKNSEWFLNTTNDTDWKTMAVPNFWKDFGLKNTNGVVWFRKHITVSKPMAGKQAKLWLGRIVDQDFVYVNGTRVGTTGYQYPPRKYTVPENLLQEGDNIITVRVINKENNGGFIKNKPYFLAVDKDTIDLKGDWRFKLGAKMPPLKGPTFIRWKPGGLYKSMISPLLPIAIKGVIWYQGESNTGNPKQYYKTFPTMISDWRSHWNQGDFPFIYVQLANFMKETDTPSESNWADLRNAQLQTLSTPNTGMAVIIDTGESNDIHPLNKEDVGKRLAQEAFKLAYNEKQTSTSPVPKHYQFKNNKVVITFTNTKELIAKNGSPLSYFEISNDGKTFVKAKATINGNKVTVFKDQINSPNAVRYAWANNPAKANLYSKEGLPASPFEIRK